MFLDMLIEKKITKITQAEQNVGDMGELGTHGRRDGTQPFIIFQWEQENTL